jgi:hypothetical protein
MSSDTEEHWFWAWLVEMTVAKTKLKNPRAKVEVVMNLIVVRAADEKQAWRKAWRVGKAEEGDDRGTLRLYGKPAITKFVGIQDIGLVHDDLADGTEVLWQLRRHTQKVARAIPKSRHELLRNLKKELGPLRRNR